MWHSRNVRSCFVIRYLFRYRFVCCAFLAVPSRLWLPFETLVLYNQVEHETRKELIKYKLIYQG
jgi:hypothetical protein